MLCGFERTILKTYGRYGLRPTSREEHGNEWRFRGPPVETLFPCIVSEEKERAKRT
jgi:hypothetical protein